jgi:hypothetical protein
MYSGGMDSGAAYPYNRATQALRVAGGIFVKVGLLVSLAAVCLLATLGATSQDNYDAYLPGAAVTLAIKVQPPQDWVLNSKIPLRVTFDKDINKKVILEKGKTQWDFTMGEKVPSYTATFKAKLGKNLPAGGTLDIPVKLEFGICMADESRCGFVNEVEKLHLKIASPGEKTAEKGGQVIVSHVFTPPE